jgi:GNAT superfamily N-acetyltransferase
MSAEPRSQSTAEVAIRPARDADEERLREIAAASKGHWGYDPDRVRAWAERLDVLPNATTRREVFVAEIAGAVLAFAALLPEGERCVLDELWVDPGAMRRGIGTRLLERVADRARELGASRLEWESEPNAVGFYEKAGARHTGATELSSWGRRLPVMALRLR